MRDRKESGSLIGRIAELRARRDAERALDAADREATAAERAATAAERQADIAHAANKRATIALIIAAISAIVSVASIVVQRFDSFSPSPKHQIGASHANEEKAPATHREDGKANGLGAP